MDSWCESNGSRRRALHEDLVLLLHDRFVCSFVRVALVRLPLVRSDRSGVALIGSRLLRMLFTLRVTGPQASDLAVLVDKCPDKLHSTRLPFGVAHVFFPESSQDAATVALVVDVEAVHWSSNGSSGAFATTNAAMLSVAITRALGTALAARAPQRPELVSAVLPIEASVSSVVVAQGSNDARALFAPLGYDVKVEEVPAVSAIDSKQILVRQTVRLTKLCPLYEVLSHVYVLGPLLDGHVRDRVLDSERDLLLVHAEGAARGHGLGERIMQAHGARRPSESALAYQRLAVLDSVGGQSMSESAVEPSLLDDARADAIALELREASAHSVVDLGCGDGKLLARLVREKALTRIVGFDVSHRALEAASSRMKLDRRGAKKSERIDLLHGSLYYSDGRLSGFDAAVLADVVQHLPEERLGDMEKVVFQDAQPTTIVVMINGAAREEDADSGLWTAKRFDAWASGVSERCGYRIRLLSPGSSQQAIRMAVFSR